jgi:hypothetical protein
MNMGRRRNEWGFRWRRCRAHVWCWAPAFEAQGLDLCGCATTPNLQPFDSADPATFPPGVRQRHLHDIPIPSSGILKFSSFKVVNRQLAFATNNLNNPVTILVAGNVTISSTVGCCFNFNVSGGNGSGGNSSFAGVGGAGGPGGFRGGDAASQAINGAAIGGAGFLAGGGAGGTASPFTNGSGATFLGLPGSRRSSADPAGGGSSNSNARTSCSGGGGGGGGGAALIAANGTFLIRDYQILPTVETVPVPATAAARSSGGGGSGGAFASWRAS